MTTLESPLCDLLFGTEGTDWWIPLCLWDIWHPSCFLPGAQNWWTKNFACIIIEAICIYAYYLLCTELHTFECNTNNFQWKACPLGKLDQVLLGTSNFNIACICPASHASDVINTHDAHLHHFDWNQRNDEQSPLLFTANEAFSLAIWHVTLLLLLILFPLQG